MTEFEVVRDAVANVLNKPASEITPDTTFRDDLGADSLDVVEIVMSIEEALDISIPDEDLESIVTVQDAVDLAKKLAV